MLLDSLIWIRPSERVSAEVVPLAAAVVIPTTLAVAEVVVFTTLLAVFVTPPSKPLLLCVPEEERVDVLDMAPASVANISSSPERAFARTVRTEVIVAEIGNANEPFSKRSKTKPTRDVLLALVF